MVNTNMFRHPKYYKELRKRNKTIQEATRQVESQQSDQVISSKKRDGECERAPGPGLKLGEMDIASSKQQASSAKLTKSQASSSKHQAPSTKAQA